MSNIKSFAYNDTTKITKHTNVKELRCDGKVKHNTLVDLDHYQKIEDFMAFIGADKVIYSSAYRCSDRDKEVGGNGKGQHTKGCASDQCFYKNGKIIPAREVCLLAQDFGFKGIGYINQNYVHLDSRIKGTYRGDETRGTSNNVGNDFYKYFNVSKSDDVKVTFRIKTSSKGWLDENVTSYNNEEVTNIAIKVDKGSIKYRVHLKKGKWLPYVTGYNINDVKNGYAGNDKVIDAIQIYYYTPSNIRPVKKAKYKVNNYPYQYDDEIVKGQDGYAGVFGKSITKFQISIV